MTIEAGVQILAAECLHDGAGRAVEPLVLLDAEQVRRVEARAQVIDDAQRLVVAERMGDRAGSSRLCHPLMVVVVEETKRLAVVADHREQRLGLVAGEIAPAGGVGDQAHRLVQVAQAMGVDRIALDEVAAQHAGGPDAKLGAPLRLDPVADGDDDVEVVEPDRLVGAGNVQILHIAFFVELALAEHVAKVLGDHRPLAAEQIRDLLLAEPDGVTGQMDVERDGAVFGLVEDDLSSRRGRRVCLHAASSSATVSGSSRAASVSGRESASSAASRPSASSGNRAAAWRTSSLPVTTSAIRRVRYS